MTHFFLHLVHQALMLTLDQSGSLCLALYGILGNGLPLELFSPCWGLFGHHHGLICR
jgi:hypothetical protein